MSCKIFQLNIITIEEDLDASCGSPHEKYACVVIAETKPEQATSKLDLNPSLFSGPTLLLHRHKAAKDFVTECLHCLCALRSHLHDEYGGCVIC